MKVRRPISRSTTINAPFFSRRQILQGEEYLFHEFALLQPASPREQSARTDAGQHPLDLGLEHDDQGKRRVGRQRGQQRAQQLHASPNGNEVSQHENEYAEQDVSGPAAANDHQELINEKRRDQDVEDRNRCEGWESESRIVRNCLHNLSRKGGTPPGQMGHARRKGSEYLLV
jgi:hypothetical protein